MATTIMSDLNLKDTSKFNSKGNVYVDAEQVISNLLDFRILTKRAVKVYMEDQCEMLEGYMQANAPWKNRPEGETTWESHARDKLKAEYVEEGGFFKEGPKKMILSISHGVSYGLYLEYNGTQTQSYLSRQRPILEPTKEKKFPEIFLGLNNLINRFSWVFSGLKVK